MTNSLNKKPSACIILIILHIFLGIGAVGGGLVLILDPSGGIIKMPLSILEHSPFPNFLIPGIILFCFLGIAPLILASGLFKKWAWPLADTLNLFKPLHWALAFSLYIGFALIIWITVEAYILNAFTLLHVIYIALGLAIQFFTMLPSVQNFYREIHSSKN